MAMTQGHRADGLTALKGELEEPPQASRYYDYSKSSKNSLRFLLKSNIKQQNVDYSLATRC
jgi:hypothetical protein